MLVLVTYAVVDKHTHTYIRKSDILQLHPYKRTYTHALQRKNITKGCALVFE